MKKSGFNFKKLLADLKEVKENFDFEEGYQLLDFIISEIEIQVKTEKKARK